MLPRLATRFAPTLFCVLLISLQALAADSDSDFKALLQQGKNALRASKYEDAIKALKKAIKLQPSCSGCYLSLAVAQASSSLHGDAFKSCDRAIEVATDDTQRADAHNLKANILLANAGDDRKKLAAAENEYRAAIQLDPKSADLRLNLARSLLRQMRDDEAKTELQTCLTLNAGSHSAQQARLMIADPRRGREDFAPEFDFQTLQGEHLSLTGLKGRILVMDFWATWCPPCRESVPELKDLIRRYPSQKLVLISVSADDNEQEWKDFIALKKMDWPQYRDADRSVIDAFNVRAYPTYLVVDADGIIRQRITGLSEQQSVVSRLKGTLKKMPQLEGEERK